MRIKQHDTLPILKMAIRDSTGAAVDLTGLGAATLRVRDASGVTRVFAAVVENALLGLVHYDWLGGGTETVGLYDCEWHFVGTTGIVTMPTSGFFRVQVFEALI